MQLQFTREEQALLVEVLQESALANVRKQAKENLLNRLLEHDLAFRYDELEDLSDFLAEVSRHLHDHFMRTEDPIMQRRQTAVQRILDKVIEAEAMV
jgi:predicted RNA-binding Zn ribbon-like protein